MEIENFNVFGPPMKKPFEVEVNCKYGAPMGRRSGNPANLEARTITLSLVRLYDYAYDKGGAYWGMGENLYCAWAEDGSDDPEDEFCVIYFRAKDKRAARKYLQEIGVKEIR